MQFDIKDFAYDVEENSFIQDISKLEIDEFPEEFDLYSQATNRSATFISDVTHMEEGECVGVTYKLSPTNHTTFPNLVNCSVILFS